MTSHAVRLAITMALAMGGLLMAAFVPARAADGTADLSPAALASAAVWSSGSADRASYDGVVQAVRQTIVAAQVPGAVVALLVKAGDSVQSGQVLLRLDARAADQTAAAGEAQVQAARAAQEVATREFERNKQLFQQNYISQAALDRAEAQYKAAGAEAAAQLANAGAARTRSGFYVVRAPYSGVIAEVSVVLGDMAMPGRALMTLYDPTLLRVSAAVPQTMAARLQNASSASPTPAAQIELPGALPARITPLKTQWLPSVDPATHSVELRLDLPSALAGVSPGMFARAWLPVGASADARLFVPAASLVRRAELTGVYVIGADGRPLLRQVRLGRPVGDSVEVLAGVSTGERVALDPQAAARVR